MNARNLASDLCRVMKEISSLLNPSPLFLKGLRRHVLHAAGKQQRSRLLLILGHLCGVSRRPLITAAAAVEAVHLATLIHDDILDGATRRRSKDTLHLSHGISSALLYGDLVFTRGVSAVNSLGNKQLTDLLLSTVRALCMGEILEAREAGRFPWNERIYRRIAGLKTAALFQFACEAPGILAGYGRGRLAMLSSWRGLVLFSVVLVGACDGSTWRTHRIANIILLDEIDGRRVSEACLDYVHAGCGGQDGFGELRAGGAQVPGLEQAGAAVAPQDVVVAVVIEVRDTQQLHVRIACQGQNRSANYRTVLGEVPTLQVARAGLPPEHVR